MASVEVVRGEHEGERDLELQGIHGTSDRSVLLRCCSNCTQSLALLAHFQSEILDKATAW